MSEGLSGTEVGKELAEHAKQAGATMSRTGATAFSPCGGGSPLRGDFGGGLVGLRGGEVERRVRCVDDLEAPTDASRADLDAREDRNFDLSTFEAWFDAFVADDQEAMAITQRRFRPEFAVAFDAWRATNPETNPAAPRGPTYMPQYRQPGLDQAKALDEQADEEFAAGVSAGHTSDNYVRATVSLASVLFLVGISAHFSSRGARYGLIALSAAVLVGSLVQLAQLPRPPS
jgi:hypothetical protein